MFMYNLQAILITVKCKEMQNLTEENLRNENLEYERKFYNGVLSSPYILCLEIGC